DCCVSPKGDLVVACHSGGPDWGSGPGGKGKLYKIRYDGKGIAQPIAIRPNAPDEVRVQFDRPLDPAALRNLANKAELTAGAYVRAGDEFESLRPGYDAVRMQLIAHRKEVRVRGVQMTPDRKSLILATDVCRDAVHYALKLPGLGRPPLAKITGPKGVLPQHPRIDLDYSLAGGLAEWQGEGITWTGWLPNLDLDVSQSIGAIDKKTLASPGRLTLRTQLDLSNMLRPVVQPGSKLDYTLPRERVTLSLTATGPFTVNSPSGELVGRSAGKSHVARLTIDANTDELIPVTITLQTSGNPGLSVTWNTAEDERPRPLALHRMLVPWAVRNPK